MGAPLSIGFQDVSSKVQDFSTHRGWPRLPLAASPSHAADTRRWTGNRELRQLRERPESKDIKKGYGKKMRIYIYIYYIHNYLYHKHKHIYMYVYIYIQNGKLYIYKCNSELGDVWCFTKNMDFKNETLSCHDNEKGFTSLELCRGHSRKSGILETQLGC